MKRLSKFLAFVKNAKQAFSTIVTSFESGGVAIGRAAHVFQAAHVDDARNFDVFVSYRSEARPTTKAPYFLWASSVIH